MKDPINIALVAIIVVLLGFTVYKNMGGNAASGSKAAGPVDVNGYTIIDVKGTPVKRLEKYDNNNMLLESGEMLDGLKTGAWITYHSDGRVKSITNYIAGKKDGLQVNLSDKGYIELQAFYKDDVFHGNWTTYATGSRKIEERVYNMGKLDGINKHYDKLGKLQKEIGFKNDLQHGMFRQYDEEGNVLLEYEYKNGEKLGGGIVTK